MRTFLNSKKTRAVLLIIGAMVVLLVVFGAGIAVGYHSGVFSSRFGQDYYHNFYGNDGVSAANPMAPMPMNPHGTIGMVIDMSSSTISIKDPRGDEESIAVDSSTVIRKMDKTITIADVKTGDQITVIGEPNDSGQVVARFIRIFDASSSIPTPSNQ